jgi:hypothetical protein
MTDDRDEARIRALFAGGAAPMADEDFTSGVMTRVRAEKRKTAGIAGALWIGVLAAGGVMLAPFVPGFLISLGGDLASGVPADAAATASGFSGLILLAAAGAAGLLAAERI